MNKEKSYFETLDLIRIIGSLWIVLYHYVGAGGYVLIDELKIFGYLTVRGNSFLDFFFMASGFCIALNYREKIQDGLISFKEFFLKHYLVFVVYAMITLPAAFVKQVLVFLTGEDEAPQAYKFVLDLFCLRTGYGSTEQPYNSPLWFINILAQIYVIYFVYTKFLRKRFGSFGYAFFIVLGITTYRDKNAFPVLYVVLQALMNFSIGVLIYELYKNKDIKSKYISGISICMLIVGMAFAFMDFKYRAFNMLGDYRISASFLLWPQVIWLVVNKHISSERAKKFVKRISGYSTSLFIWHHPLIYIYRGLSILCGYPDEINKAYVIVLYVITLAVVAAISDVFLEKRIIKLFKKNFGIENSKG